MRTHRRDRVRCRDELGAGLPSLISRVDVVGIPSSDIERSRRFYVETLGLRPDENARYEFWVGDTCFAIWTPAWFGVEYQPQANSIVLLHVDDVASARAELEAKGVTFQGETSTPVSAIWPTSRIPTATR